MEELLLAEFTRPLAFSLGLLHSSMDFLREQYYEIGWQECRYLDDQPDKLHLSLRSRNRQNHYLDQMVDKS